MHYLLLAGMALVMAFPAAADRYRPDVDVNVPAEVFSSGGQ